MLCTGWTGLQARPLVVADVGIVGPQRPNKVDLHLRDVRPTGGLRLPQDLLPDREVPSLLGGEVAFDQGTVGAAVVVQCVGPILADVYLPVRIGDLVDDHDRQSASGQRLGRQGILGACWACKPNRRSILGGYRIMAATRVGTSQHFTSLADASRPLVPPVCPARRSRNCTTPDVWRVLAFTDDHPVRRRARCLPLADAAVGRHDTARPPQNGSSLAEGPARPLLGCCSDPLVLCTVQPLWSSRSSSHLYT